MDDYQNPLQQFSVPVNYHRHPEYAPLPTSDWMNPHGDLGYSTKPHDMQRYQNQENNLMEKKRKRRESHNAVERRRRDNINNRITELKALLPKYQSGVHNSSKQQNAKEPTKGEVLKDASNYIKELEQRVKELLKELEGRGQRPTYSPSRADHSAILTGMENQEKSQENNNAFYAQDFSPFLFDKH